MIDECQGNSYNERLKMLGLTTLENRGYVDMWGVQGDEWRILFRVQRTKTRGHSIKLYKEEINKIETYENTAFEIG